MGQKVPLPPVQVPPLALSTLPVSCTAGLLAQICRSAPAFTTGASVKLMVTWSVTAAQYSVPVEVRVKVTDPEAISAAVGVYCTANEVLLGK